VAVVAEDAAAVSGCFIAAAALAATQLTGSSVRTKFRVRGLGFRV